MGDRGVKLVNEVDERRRRKRYSRAGRVEVHFYTDVQAPAWHMAQRQVSLEPDLTREGRLTALAIRKHVLKRTSPCRPRLVLIGAPRTAPRSCGVRVVEKFRYGWATAEFLICDLHSYTSCLSLSQA